MHNDHVKQEHRQLYQQMKDEKEAVDQELEDKKLELIQLDQDKEKLRRKHEYEIENIKERIEINKFNQNKATEEIKVTR